MTTTFDPAHASTGASRSSVRNAAVNLAGWPAWKLFLAIMLVGAVCISVKKPTFGGDAMEYTLMTVAVAEHFSPELRPSDLQLAREVLPEFADLYPVLERHWSAGEPLPPGLIVDRRGQVRALHFSAYSALAAIPFRLARLVGANPMKGFMWVDLVCLATLAVAARAWFGSTRRSLATVGIFLITVGIPYWNWSSPEFACAALGLAALLCMGARAFVAGGILAGLPAMQNPPMAALLAFGPAIVLAEHAVNGGGLDAAISMLRRHWRTMALGAMLGGALVCVPVFLSLRYFDTWNIIARVATDPGLISHQRLWSYYMDLNQGMIIAIPGVLLLAAWRLARRPGLLLLVIPVAVCSLMLAIPALSTHNWNSGANGMMRYIVWGSVPFLFLMLALLRTAPVWPRAGVAAFVIVQVVSVAHGDSYQYTYFSPLARWVMVHAPAWYNPEPEVFAERLTHEDGNYSRDGVYRFEEGGARKTLYHAANHDGIVELCGARGMPGAAAVVEASREGWTYLNGELTCTGGPLAFERIGMGRLQRKESGQLQDGWSGVEMASTEEGGIWSIGPVSTFAMAPGAGQPVAIGIRGSYWGSNRATRVRINGKDLGDWKLDRLHRIPLDGIDARAGLKVELRHQAPGRPSQQDTRLIAFQLKDLLVMSRTGTQSATAQNAP